MATLKSSLEESNKKLSDENTSLKQQNEVLQRALIRSATVPDEHHVAEAPSPEESYRERVNELAKKALAQVRI